MQKINIKKLTKEKLAEMYAEAKSAYDAAMDDEERRVRELEEQGSELARANEALEKAKNESRELAKQLGERMVELKAAEGRAKRKDELLDEALHRLEVEKAIAEDYHESLKWCMAHPWRNVWRCVKEYFRF